MAYVVSVFQLSLGVVCFVWSIVTIIGLFFFGRLIRHQAKIWALAKRGYVQIRHIREDMNEVYYFIRFVEGYYDFSGGVYMEQKDTKTNTPTILPVFNYNLLSKKPINELTELELQLKQFFDNIKSNKIMDIKTLPWGIPTITYFGTDPQPVNYRDRKKIYDAKNIAAMIKRIIMTKEWKLVRMVLILCSVAIIGLLLLGFLDYGMTVKSNNIIGQCQKSLNMSLENYYSLVERTTVAQAQNSTVIV